MTAPSPQRTFRYYDFVMAAFVTVLLCSNLIGAAKAAQVTLPIIGPVTFGAGVLFFPISYIFGDILTEVYGYGRDRRVVWAGFAALVFASFMSLVVLALPVAPTHVHAGGVMSGQTLMAAADTAMVLALMQHFGRFRPCTTVQQSSSFLRPLSAQDAVVHARVLRAGKTLAFGEIELAGAQDGKSVCRASTTYALL